MQLSLMTCALDTSNGRLLCMWNAADKENTSNFFSKIVPVGVYMKLIAWTTIFIYFWSMALYKQKKLLSLTIWYFGTGLGYFPARDYVLERLLLERKLAWGVIFLVVNNLCRWLGGRDPKLPRWQVSAVHYASVVSSCLFLAHFGICSCYCLVPQISPIAATDLNKLQNTMLILKAYFNKTPVSKILYPKEKSDWQVRVQLTIV